MNVKKTALIIVLCILCQQAGAVALAFIKVLPIQYEKIQNEQASCHDNQLSVNPSDTEKLTNAHHHGDSYSSSISDQSCSDVGCQCCIGGCSSVTSSTVDRAVLSLDNPPATHYLFAILQVSTKSLFRPPITA